MRHAYPRVLVLGGGTAGNALAVLLRKGGVDVDLVESTSDWNADSGSGITLQGSALRVLREVGVLPGVIDQGYAFDSLGITAADGAVLHLATDLRTGGPDLPATVGMRRPDLQRLLSEAVRSSGARVRLGTRAVEVRQGGDVAEVGFSDGSSGAYDLVVIAEGVHSPTRALIGIEARPVPTGMAIWRAAVARPRGVERTDVAYGGPCFIAGYCPTGPDTMYAYLVERNRDRADLEPDSYADEMRRLAAGYGGAWPEIAAGLTDPRRINYTWFERYLVEGPWHRGRFVLAGDAAHCCPPTIAQGAAMSLEDVLVLAELLTGAADWDDDLLNGYRERRIPRVRMVVDASVRIGEWLLNSDPDADIPGLMNRTMPALAAHP